VNLTKRVSHGFQFHVHTHGVRALIHSRRPRRMIRFRTDSLTRYSSTRNHRGLSDFDGSSNRCCQFTWELPSPTWEHQRNIPAGKRLCGFWSSQVGRWEDGARRPLQDKYWAAVYNPLLAETLFGRNWRDQRPPDRLAGPGVPDSNQSWKPQHYIKTQCLAFPIRIRDGETWPQHIDRARAVRADFSILRQSIFRRSNPGQGCAGTGATECLQWPVFGGLHVQFRAEFFNILNHSTFPHQQTILTFSIRNGQRSEAQGSSPPHKLLLAKSKLR